MNISRRSVLSAFTALGASLFARFAHPAAAQRGRVVVVGAGVSGLAAASELRRRGFDVVVLEARERIGGRVWSAAKGGFVADLGASWIHGVRGNPITALAAQFGAQTRAFDYESMQRYRDGEEIADAVDQRIDGWSDALEEYFEERDSIGRRTSLADGLRSVIARLARTPSEREELAYVLNTEIEHEYAADLANLSHDEFDAAGEYPGGDVLFPGGYGAIVDGLARGLDVRLAHVVTRIESLAAGARVTTRAGGSVRSFDADAVLVTLPLGVLQAGAVEFAPALPERKRAAIARLGMGLLDKLWLRFDEAFWPMNQNVFGYVSPQRGLWAEWVNVARFDARRTPILLGFNAGSVAEQLEKSSDAEIVASGLAALRGMFGADVPEPVEARLTRWRADEFARGSYSYVAVGASAADYDVLAEPVGKRLFFAGEATSRRHSSTVHGAYSSGLRAAEEIAKARGSA